MSNVEFESYVDPKSMTYEQIVEEMRTLYLGIGEIEVQLGDRNRTTADGSRVSSKQYWEWNRRARAALRYKKARYSDLKRRRDQLDTQVQLQETELVNLIYNLYSIAKRSIATPSATEQAIFIVAVKMLRSRGIQL